MPFGLIVSDAHLIAARRQTWMILASSPCRCHRRRPATSAGLAAGCRLVTTSVRPSVSILYLPSLSILKSKMSSSPCAPIDSSTGGASTCGRSRLDVQRIEYADELLVAGESTVFQPTSKSPMVRSFGIG